jgi:putative hemolysin
VLQASDLKKLISELDLSAATHLSEDSPLLALIASISGIEKVNKLYDSLSPYQNLEFVEKLFEFLDIEVEVDPADLERVPKHGPFILVANHPFGAIDGMMLLKVFAPLRADFKVMANFLLQHVEPIKNYFLAVNPFEDRKSAYSNIAGLKKAMSHVADGNCLGIFPAGEVSSFQMDTKSIADRKWQSAALKIIRNSKVPVIPVYFDGSNSRLFHLLGLVHPSLRTLTLPQEMMRKRGKKVRLRIGKPISVNDQEDFDSLEQYGRFLRAKTYALGSALEVKRDYFRLFQTRKKPEEIVNAVPVDTLKAEVAEISNYLLFSHDPFECYLAPSIKIPHLLTEIGRLRELTFREVGEGTNKSTDLDEYDIYYHHLILWDKDNASLAGAYRIGLGKDIIARFGKKGFYLSSLFKLDKALNPILEQSVELGRSFIPKVYQQKRLPLFLLWKGILTFLITRPEYRFMIGPVSISSNYQEVSRGLIIEFVKKHYYNDDLAQYVKPRNEFKVKSSNIDKEALLSATSNDLKKLDKLISDIEPSSYAIPVLLKKYLHQNARIIGFNCDPLFNNALDGLMILDFKDIPQDTLDNLNKEL